MESDLQRAGDQKLEHPEPELDPNIELVNDNTPESGAEGSMLDHTTLIWTTELGKANSHTRENIPFLLLGNGSGFQMGRGVDFQGCPTIVS